MNVLSLFDGISCGMIALERAEVKVTNYYASEIKKSAIKCSAFNYPNIIHIGDVTKVRFSNGVLYTENGEYNTGGIDLLIGGSPCQDFSSLKWINWQAKGLDGEKSRLFYEYLRIFKEINPKYFLLENVKMKKAAEKELSDFLGVTGVHINSNLVSYQNRPRIYWTNIPRATIPSDKNINFQDYKETDEELLAYTAVKRTPARERMWNNGKGKNSVGTCANITHAKKIFCITRKQDRAPNSGLIEYKDFCRYLSRKEIELGQTLPLGYTDCLTYSQMQDVCGDGWTVDVIAHLFKGLRKG